jgi:hypothetical protein
MKFANTSQAATRQGRMDQLRRDRSAAQALRAVFPAVHQLRIELKFEGPFSNIPTSQSHVLYPAARAHFGYPCPYFDCDGHFDLSDAVTAALRDVSNVAAGVLGCGGSRARDHASKQPCLLQIIYEVTAIYHEKA